MKRIILLCSLTLSLLGLPALSLAATAQFTGQLDYDLLEGTLLPGDIGLASGSAFSGTLNIDGASATHLAAGFYAIGSGGFSLTFDNGANVSSQGNLTAQLKDHGSYHTLGLAASDGTLTFPGYGGSLKLSIVLESEAPMPTELSSLDFSHYTDGYFLLENLGTGDRLLLDKLELGGSLEVQEVPVPAAAWLFLSALATTSAGRKLRR